MLITKTLKLVIVCAEFDLLFYRHPEVFYTYLILRLVSPEGPLWLKLREQDNFFVFSDHLESQIKTFINLQKGRKTFSKKRYLVVTNTVKL